MKELLEIELCAVIDVLVVQVKDSGSVQSNPGTVQNVILDCRINSIWFLFERLSRKFAARWLPGQTCIRLIPGRYFQHVPPSWLARQGRPDAHHYNFFVQSLFEGLVQCDAVERRQLVE
jgi:hypothetical protein